MEKLRKQEQGWQHKTSATRPNPKNLDFLRKIVFTQPHWSLVIGARLMAAKGSHIV